MKTSSNIKNALKSLQKEKKQNSHGRNLKHKPSITTDIITLFIKEGYILKMKLNFHSRANFFGSNGLNI